MQQFQQDIQTLNISKLFTYLQKSQYHNVSANFSGFVRREFDTHFARLEDEIDSYANLKRMIEYSEIGKFNDAKKLLDPAFKEYKRLLEKLNDMQLIRQSPRKPSEKGSQIPDQDFSGKRDTHSEDNKGAARPEKSIGYLKNQDFPTPTQQDLYERVQGSRVNDFDSYGRNQKGHTLEYVRTENNRGSGKISPEKQINIRQQPQRRYDLSQPQCPQFRLQENSDARSPQYQTPPESQKKSSQAFVVRDDDGKSNENIAKSSYRQEFPSYPIEYHERLNSERKYISNETETYGYESSPSELARKFKELYNNEWAYANDEIRKLLGTERAVRHLLWIVTEAWLIAVDIADRQLRGMEKATLDLMTTPGSEYHGGYMPKNLGDKMPGDNSLILKYRKQASFLSVPYVKEECRDKISRMLKESSGYPPTLLSDSSCITAYILKCAELVWLMCVQDPPIMLEYITKATEGSRFNHEHYSIYTKAGTMYDYGVWPMLRQGKDGHILSKGIAQGI